MQLDKMAGELTRIYGFSGGPESAFEEVGRHTFITLLRNGLLPESKVLDYGCGAMRLGYWIMRFLDRGNYYGIEPNEEHLQAGKDIVIGENLLASKTPTFSKRGDFNLNAFDVQFNYVVARSIFTHFNPAAIDLVLGSLPSCLAPNGALIASFWPPRKIGGIVCDGEALINEPASAGLDVAYTKEFLVELAARHGLSARRLDYVVNDQPWIMFSL